MDDMLSARRSGCRQRPRQCETGGFTLVEVLVVIAILSMLIAILLPSLRMAKQSALSAVCLARQGQLSHAIIAYSTDHQRKIPYGPKAPPGTLTNFYPMTGTVTNIVSLESGQPVGLGLMLGNQLSKNPHAIFCPGADQDIDTNAQLANVGIRQAQSSYFYRHASVHDMFAPPPTPPRIRIDKLGANRLNGPIRALAMDSDMVVHPVYIIFGIYTRTHHQRQTGNILFTDGHAKTVPITGGQAFVHVASSPQYALGRILEVLEWADSQ